MSGSLFLLGPQRPNPNMPTVLARAERPGRVVYITAGWRHDENDDEALKRDVGVNGMSLPLYAWFEELAKTAPGLFAAHHQQQDEIRKLKAMYRLRLAPALESVRVMLAQKDLHPDASYVQEELDDAIAVLRGLRTRFIAHCDVARQAFVDRAHPTHHPKVQRRMADVRNILADARAVLIAGGHVGVLRSRLEFFGLGPLLTEAMEQGTRVIAWSAGAMALCDEVVLFHDDPPTGQHNAEVLDRGLGLAPGIVYLPHARQRLFLDDRVRVSLLAARFNPVPCIGVENGAVLIRHKGEWKNRGKPDAAFRLGTDGGIHPLEVTRA